MRGVGKGPWGVPSANSSIFWLAESIFERHMGVLWSAARALGSSLLVHSGPRRIFLHGSEEFRSRDPDLSDSDWTESDFQVIFSDPW